MKIIDEPPKTPPIEYLRGVKVVDIGDLRVARGMSRRPYSSCRHSPLVYDQKERRIWCEDCEQDVEAFDAFLSIVENFNSAEENIKRRLKEVEAAEKHNILRIAAKQLDEMFRRKNTVPACPHCGEGIFPEDVARMGTANRRWEEAKRARAAREEARP